MYCTKCGKEFQCNDDFCGGCGAKVQAELELCASCGCILREGNAFCIGCGHGVNHAQELPEEQQATQPDILQQQFVQQQSTAQWKPRVEQTDRFQKPSSASTMRKKKSRMPVFITLSTVAVIVIIIIASLGSPVDVPLEPTPQPAYIGTTIDPSQAVGDETQNQQFEQTHTPAQDLSSRIGWQTTSWNREYPDGHIVSETHTLSGWIKATDTELLQYASNSIGLSETFTLSSVGNAIGRNLITYSAETTAIIFGTVRLENITADFPFTESNPHSTPFEASIGGFRGETGVYTLSVFFSSGTQHYHRAPTGRSHGGPIPRMISNTWQVNYAITWVNAFEIPTPNVPEGIDNTEGKHIRFSGRWALLHMLGVEADNHVVRPIRTWEDNVTTPPETPALDGTAQVGNIVHFGGYDWRILDVQGNHALIISEYIIRRRAFEYGSIYRSADWEFSTLRQYLNSGFLENFSQADRLRIRETTIINNGNSRGEHAGNNTADMVFLLSIDELGDYFGDNNYSRIAYSLADRVVRWWLRSAGGSSIQASFVDSDGSLRSTHASHENGVRPAMWVSLGS